MISVYTSFFCLSDYTGVALNTVLIGFFHMKVAAKKKKLCERDATSQLACIKALSEKRS